MVEDDADCVKAEPEVVSLEPDEVDENMDQDEVEEEGFHINNYEDNQMPVSAQTSSEYTEACKALAEKQERDAARAAEKRSRGSRGFALGSVSDKIVPWLRARFERREGGKTAIQEVIKLYAYDFPRDSIYFPLESFQGMVWLH